MMIDTVHNRTDGARSVNTYCTVDPQGRVTIERRGERRTFRDVYEAAKADADFNRVWNHGFKRTLAGLSRHRFQLPPPNAIYEWCRVQSGTAGDPATQFAIFSERTDVADHAASASATGWKTMITQVSVPKQTQDARSSAIIDCRVVECDRFNHHVDQILSAAQRTITRPATKA